MLTEKIKAIRKQFPILGFRIQDFEFLSQCVSVVKSSSLCPGDNAHSKIKGVGVLEDDAAIRQVAVADRINDQEQIVAGPMDPVQTKVGAEHILDTVVLERGTGEPVVVEVVVNLNLAHLGRKLAFR